MRRFLSSRQCVKLCFVIIRDCAQHFVVAVVVAAVPYDTFVREEGEGGMERAAGIGHKRRWKRRHLRSIGQSRHRETERKVLRGRRGIFVRLLACQKGIRGRVCVCVYVCEGRGCKGVGLCAAYIVQFILMPHALGAAFNAKRVELISWHFYAPCHASPLLYVPVRASISPFLATPGMAESPVPAVRSFIFLDNIAR